MQRVNLKLWPRLGVLMRVDRNGCDHTDNGESIEIQLIGRLHHDAKTDEAKAERPNRK